MAALCLYLADGSRRDLEDTLEKATSHYLRGGSPRHASKAALLQLDLLKRPPTKGSKADALRAGLRDAATGLVAQSTHETHLVAALLLEQAALCFRSMRPALPRKFAFHLILAGFRFIQCGQRRHAVRAPRATACTAHALTHCTHGTAHAHAPHTTHAPHTMPTAHARTAGARLRGGARRLLAQGLDACGGPRALHARAQLRDARQGRARVAVLPAAARELAPTCRPAADLHEGVRQHPAPQPTARLAARAAGAALQRPHHQGAARRQRARPAERGARRAHGGRRAVEGARHAAQGEGGSQRGRQLAAEEQGGRSRACPRAVRAGRVGLRRGGGRQPDARAPAAERAQARVHAHARRRHGQRCRCGRAARGWGGGGGRGAGQPGARRA